MDHPLITRISLINVSSEVNRLRLHRPQQTLQQKHRIEHALAKSIFASRTTDATGVASLRQ